MTMTSSAFDRSAAQWDLNPARLQLHQQVAQTILNSIPLNKDWRALDFGCGTGLMSFLLSPRLGCIDSIDSSGGMINELRKKLAAADSPENIRPHCGLLETDTFNKEAFNFLFSVLTLHHVENVEELIGIFSGLLKPGGYIALADLDKEDGNFHKETETEVYHHGFEREYISDLLRAAGFAEIRAETAGCREREMEDGSSCSYPLFLISAVKKG